MCSKCCLNISSLLCFVTKIEFFPCADMMSYFLLLLLVHDLLYGNTLKTSAPVAYAPNIR